MTSAGDRDELVRAHLEAAADEMVREPVRWRRVHLLARRRAILSALLAAAVTVLVAALLVFGGSVGRAKLHPREGSWLPLPFVGIAIPDLVGLPLDRAIAKLDDLDLKGVRIGDCPRQRPCTVRATRPAAGLHVLAGAVVELYPRSASGSGTQGGRKTTKSPATKSSGEVSGATKSHPTKTPGTKEPTTKGPTTKGGPEGAQVARIAVRLAPPRVPADGHSSTTVTATILDTRGRPVAGLQPQLLSSDSEERLGSFLATAEPGVYTATLTRSRTAGAVVVTVEARGARGEASLTQAAGAPAAIKLTLSPAKIPADGSSTTILLARVSDENGNPVTGQSIEFQLGKESVSGSEAQAGVYTATVASAKRPTTLAVVAKDQGLSSNTDTLRETAISVPETEGGGAG